MNVSLSFKLGLLTIVLGISFAMGWCVGVKLHLTASPTMVKLNDHPTPAQQQAASLVLRRQETGHLSGSAALPTGITLSPLPCPEPEVTRQITIPVSGNLHTQYIDAKTGRVLGEGDHSLNGNTVVTIAGQTITADSQFSGTVVTALTIPKPPVPTWEMGVYGFAGGKSGWGGMVEKDFPLGEHLAGFAAVDQGRERVWKAGIKIKF